MASDAWMETCLVGISKLDGEEVQFASKTETIDFDIGEKGIEGVLNLGGGRIKKWNPEGDSTVTFEVYPLEAGAGEGFFDLVHSDDVIATSSATSTTTDKLVDTNVNFTTLGVAVGDRVRNTTDDTKAYVTNVDSTTQLTLSSDIMASGEDYILTDSPYRVVNDHTRTRYRILLLWSDKTTAIKAGEAVANTYNALRVGFAHGHFIKANPSFTDGVLKWTVQYKVVPFDKAAGGNLLVESCAAAGGSDALPAIADYTSACKFA